MAALVFDILWVVAAWLVVGLGAWLVLYALLADSIRSVFLRRRDRVASKQAAAGRVPVNTPPARLRCPGGWGRVLLVVPWRHGCWYDMSAAAAVEGGRFLCPECGRRSTARRLKKARRRYRLAFVGLAIATIGLAGRYGRQVHRQGWKAVPDAVLVLAPFDERSWVEEDLANSASTPRWIVEAAKEISQREDAGTLGGWATRHLTIRVRDRFERDPDYGVDDASRAAFARLESTAMGGGLSDMPQRLAFDAIAQAAGVRLEVDEQAIRAGFIDLDRPVTIPALGSMTCEQALDWACDRGRARQGWEMTAWDVVDGAVRISTETMIYDRWRYGVFLKAPASHWWPQLRTIVLKAPLNGDVFLATVGDAAVVGAPARVQLEVERAGRLVGDGAGFSRPRDEFEQLEVRLRTGPMTPISADESARVLLHRIEAELGIPVSVDSWGLDLDTPLGDIVAERTRAAFDRTSASADPFGEDEPGDDIEPVPTAMAALQAFSLDFVHDGHSLAIGYRAPQLLIEQAFYRVPEGEPTRAGSGTIAQLRADGERRMAWESRILAQIEALRTERGARIAALFFGDRLVLEGPPCLQALAAPLVEQAFREWDAKLQAEP